LRKTTENIGSGNATEDVGGKSVAEDFGGNQDGKRTENVGRELA
jgi:hypothetical protein